MACFLVPTAEAVITTVVGRHLKKREQVNEKEHIITIMNDEGLQEEYVKCPFSEKLGWLSKLNWGGAALLLFEHLWHGEVVPFFPFLTAASTSEGTQEMLHEMATTGVSMALLTTAVWSGMLVVSHVISLEKTPTSISSEYRNKYVSVGVQSPTEIKASGGLQECADENVSKADAHSAARTRGAFLNKKRSQKQFTSIRR